MQMTLMIGWWERLVVDKKLLSPHIKNGVLSIKSLKQTNPPLSMYVLDNKESIEDRLNIKILNDTVAIRGVDNIRSYLLYYYGDTVNLTKLRKESIVIYNNICALGVPEEVVKNMGFKVQYDSKISKDELVEELKAIANKDGVIRKLDKRLDNKIRYEANKVNMTVRGYVEKLGFFLDYKGILSKEKDDVID